MQLKSSTDYAIRIVCYLATHNGMISTTELSKQLYIASTYIPKVAKKVKRRKYYSKLDEGDKWWIYTCQKKQRIFL
mgnify:CR=1 FL=1